MQTDRQGICTLPVRSLSPHKASRGGRKHDMVESIDIAIGVVGCEPEAQTGIVGGSRCREVVGELLPVAGQVEGDALDAELDARTRVVMEIDGDVMAAAGLGQEGEVIGLTGLDGDVGLEELGLLAGVDDLHLQGLVTVGRTAGRAAGDTGGGWVELPGVHPRFEAGVDDEIAGRGHTVPGYRRVGGRGRRRGTTVDRGGSRRRGGGLTDGCGR